MPDNNYRQNNVPQDYPNDPDAIETKPLNLRTSKYLDESSETRDWDDEDSFDRYETAEEADEISTFAEVFVPLHDDSIGTVIRKGMVIVCVIIILCCLVALLMRHGAVSACIFPDVTAQVTDTANAVAAWCSTL